MSLCRATPSAALFARNSSTHLSHSQQLKFARSRFTMQEQRASVSSSTTTSGPKQRSLRVDTINPNILKAEYAVRGAVLLKANEFSNTIENARKSGTKNPLPFDEIVYCNIGNPQSLKQVPLTFHREVLALTVAPHLLQNPAITSVLKEDVVKRARQLIANIPGGSGAYSHSKGVEAIRADVANFIARRDGFPSNPDNIFLTDGASPAVQMILRALIRDRNDGIMIPIPQYPLYSATIELLGGTQVQYFLDEDNSWGLSATELRRSIKEARNRGINVRALVVINPGNPTGQCLERQNMQEIARFCAEEGILLMADEVYQENIYSDTKKWVSFKRVMHEIGLADQLELVSFHSVSKGFIGECGRRGGYMELHNIDPAVADQLYKVASVNLSPNSDGQIMMGLMVNPPQPGDASYPQYVQERDSTLASLKRRATTLVGKLNQMEGVKCNQAEGAMYAFPQISLPAKFVAEALSKGMAPDLLYCLKLLEGAGVCVVPGSGFGQRDGTFHFRTTFLPPENQINSVVERMAQVHSNLLKQYN